MKQEKQYLLDEVTDHMTKHDTFLVMNYTSVSANSFNDFRREIAKGGGNVEMVRKRILVKAAAEKGITLDVDQLPGHIGVVFAGSDPIETTKYVFKFKKDNKIDVLGGRFEGKMYSGADIETLSKLPGKDEMRAQLLGTLEAPMAQMLAVVDALLCSVPYCLEEKSKLEN